MMANHGGAVLVAGDVTRVYGEGDTAVHVMRGVSLETDRATLTAVMGPSGSGKSTLMHIGPIVRDLPRSEPHDVIEAMQEPAAR